MNEENAREENSGRRTNLEKAKEGQDSSRSETADVSAIRKEETPPDLSEGAPLQISEDDDST